MAETQTEQERLATQVYEYAAQLIVQQNKNAHEVKVALMERGLDEETATIVVDRVEDEIRSARKSRAQKDMLFGALWCIGGTVATMANIGYIFWGAILFGGIQFFKGVYNATN